MKPIDYTQPMADAFVVVNDDAEAAKIALFFGLADKIKDPRIPGCRFHIEVYDDHVTHWVACGRFWGFDRPSEDGWCAWFFPKRGMTRDQLQERLRSDPSEWSE